MGIRHDTIIRESNVRLGVRKSANSLKSAMNNKFVGCATADYCVAITKQNLLPFPSIYL